MSVIILTIFMSVPLLFLLNSTFKVVISCFLSDLEAMSYQHLTLTVLKETSLLYSEKHLFVQSQTVHGHVDKNKTKRTLQR